jgi:hypothetical protein
MTIHRFESTERAYDATQCDPDIKTGDILVIGNIIGVADTWPFVVTKESGQLHNFFWESQEARDWWHKNMTPDSWLELLTTIKSEEIQTEQLATIFANEFQDWLNEVFGFSLKNLPDYDDVGVEWGLIYKAGEFKAWAQNEDGTVMLWSKAEVREHARAVTVYPCAYQDHDAHVKTISGEILERRLSHGYVGSWKHLDQHEYIGRMVIEATSVLDNEVDPEDWCEPRATTLFVKVYSGQNDALVVQALHDHFTVWGCAHEYDCCGCRSYRAGLISKLGNGYWRVTQHSSRNY